MVTIYCSEKFPYEKYLSIFDMLEYEYCFIRHIWRYIKNLIKLYNKKEDKRKWGAKIILFYRILTEQSHIVDFYRKHKLPEELQNLYFRIRTEGLTDEDVALIEKVKMWSENEEVRIAIKDHASYGEYLITKTNKDWLFCVN